MEFDEYDYLEKTVENTELPKVKETANGAGDIVRSGEKDRPRSSKRRSDDKDDGDDERRRSKRSRSGDEYRDHERSKERGSSHHRSQSRDGERDRHGSSREHRDRDRGKDRDREERNGKERDRDRDRKEHDRDVEREREREKERERERSRRSRSRSERRRSDQDEKDREKSRDRELKEKEREKERETREQDRESRRYKERKEEAEPEADPERDQRTVFAYQISLKADERDVYEFFSRAGKVRDVRLIMDRNSRRSKGVGYIEFYDAMSVPMAIALSGQPLLGQPVMVKPSEAEKNLVQSTTAKINFVRCLSHFGAVELVQLPHDESGHCKGFGFVQFARLEDARNALNLNGQVEIAGRPIKVSAVTDQVGAQDGGTNVGDFDDDEGGGLALNARSRALLMQKLDRTGTASSITGSLGTPTLPTAPILGAAPAMSPAIAPLLSGSVLAIPGLPVAGLQLPASTIPTIETIGVPSDCILLKNMFDPKTETEPDFELDIKEDVQEECSRFGGVKHIHVDKNSAGFVYMRFENMQGAVNAQRALHGRWFAGKMITATFMVPQTYEAKFPDSR
ncbi:CC1-LIKE SPLICING FACTOR [Salix purpurea]|uniref:CC1-LIKE SPLICING FACTOR n=1 Tax=Salix purpurea TaxID=77065 RepID=A0A9Q0PRQ3_SALPP|nr:CC1-LIKE SPLICING FACTOR [Salix purpurea]